MTIVTPKRLCHPGLYDPQDVRDQCGFGLVAHQRGQSSHRLVEIALESLSCMTHRGGVAADGVTGDGCGILLSMPRDFVFAQLDALGVSPSSDLLDAPERLAMGMLYLNPEERLQAAAKACIDELIDQHGLTRLAWRSVPVDESVCGEIAHASLPVIMQVIIDGSQCSSVAELNRKLYCIRRYAEGHLQQDPYFYVASLSASVLVYKALVMPNSLAHFYLDLHNPELQASIVVFHQRFSTNTLPRWPLAQPFRYLAHNGEINTIRGNRQWAMARMPKFQTDWLPDLGAFGDLVNQQGSDSSALDNMLDVLLSGGMDLFRATRILLPPAWQNVDHMDAKARAFYEYNSMHMEPWDGPAGIVLTDGRYAMCMLDRNGLRPARWVLTEDEFITVASEIGTFSYEPKQVVAKGRVGPGQVLVVDTHEGRLLHTGDVEKQLKEAHPFRSWLKTHAFRIQAQLVDEIEAVEPMPAEQLKIFQKLYLVSQEECQQVLMPMARTGQEATGSMGDDTPMAVLSRQIRPLADYFRQQFAQVTNPAIDPLRESIVMSLESCLGKERNIFEESPERARRIILKSPILSRSKFQQMTQLTDSYYQSEFMNLYYSPDKHSLREAIIKLCDRAEAAVRAGKVILVLNDRELAKDMRPIPALLATGAVHHHLIKKGLRCDSNIIVKTASVRDAHQCATLIGVGATAVYPYLAYQIIDARVRSGELTIPAVEALRHYRKALAKGLLKILSKMGISAIASYRGAQLYDLVGIGQEVVDLCFVGAISRINGMGFDTIEAEQAALVKFAWSARKPLVAGGLIKYMHGGEYHAFNPDVVVALQQAVQSQDLSAYRDYVAAVDARGIAYLRDLLACQLADVPIDLKTVEPAAALYSRFDSAGMSLGALSPEAHETLAVAMNRLGARSNSGEGGEDPARFGTEKNSKIKQVASGRFGVTPAYLKSAEVIQIKIAQGAKPGEGGQLPGSKVNALIARLRYSVPGVTLISPPPHHDIYSIEDLAQLIFDLKQVNPQALVSVKLVSAPGIGTIAAGVAKAFADLITVSGYDGGTAASPLTSIRYAGSPWELGLSEVQQTLRANGLRGRVRLQVDGGLKTGLDVIKGAILGAESFGFGTTPMVAMGCKYLRICHLNNCATGVATQQVQLREQHFHGDVEKVMRFFEWIAEDTREWLARLGMTSLKDIIGQTHLLKTVEGISEKHQSLDLSALLSQAYTQPNEPYYCQVARNDPYDATHLAQRMAEEIVPAIEAGQGGRFEYAISNCDRSIGAYLSGILAERQGQQRQQEPPIHIHFVGTAGQSFAVWNAQGLDMSLEGDANDYVGKGMAGGQVVLYPPKDSRFESHQASIIGNTCLYGATGGTLLAAGRAGERFAIRNSGAVAVIEGTGDHCCEYMTGGVVVVLGETGYNFGAGMTGGMAYVWDFNHQFVDHYNRELIDIMRIRQESMEAYQAHLLALIRLFVGHTGSQRGQLLLKDFDDYVGQFWLIKPKAASLESLLSQSLASPE